MPGKVATIGEVDLLAEPELYLAAGEHERLIRLRYWASSAPILPPLCYVCPWAGREPLCLGTLFREAWRVAGLPDPGEEAPYRPGAAGAGGQART